MIPAWVAESHKKLLFYPQLWFNLITFMTKWSTKISIFAQIRKKYNLKPIFIFSSSGYNQRSSKQGKKNSKKCKNFKGFGQNLKFSFLWSISLVTIDNRKILWNKNGLKGKIFSSLGTKFQKHLAIFLSRLSP